MTEIIDAGASDSNVELARCWLRNRRQRYSHNDDVWTLLFRWQKIKPLLQSKLLAGRYRFSPLRRVRRGDGDDLAIWSAMDSLVLKALAIVLTDQIAPQLSTRCYHLAGRGGAKAAVRNVVASLPGNQFVFRTDVKSDYASIRHEVLMAQTVRSVCV
jgi:RNA-directed DNA polymerase